MRREDDLDLDPGAITERGDRRQRAPGEQLDELWFRSPAFDEDRGDAPLSRPFPGPGEVLADAPDRVVGCEDKADDRRDTGVGEPVDGGLDLRGGVLGAVGGAEMPRRGRLERPAEGGELRRRLLGER